MAGRAKVSARIADIFAKNKWTWKSWHGVPEDPFVPSDIEVNDMLDRMMGRLSSEGLQEVGSEYTRWCRILIRKKSDEADVYLRVGTLRIPKDES